VGGGGRQVGGSLAVAVSGIMVAAGGRHSTRGRVKCVLDEERWTRSTQ